MLVFAGCWSGASWDVFDLCVTQWGRGGRMKAGDLAQGQGPSLPRSGGSNAWSAPQHHHSSVSEAAPFVRHLEFWV